MIRSAIPPIVAAAAIASAGPVHGATYLLRPDGSGDFATIQDAVTGAADGDVIELADGLFTGDGNRDIDFLGKALTLRSQSGNPQACVIDCDGRPGYEHRGFYFQNGEGPGTLVEGITLTRGHKSETAGAVSCLEASPTFTNCVFSNSTSWHSGGVFHGVDCSSAFTDCVFSGNTAYESGGAVNLFGGAAAFTRCTFSNNVTVMYHGGAIRCNSTSPEIRDCRFELNSAYGAGGAIRCYPNSDPTLTRCVFVDNSAALGGAVDCFLSSPGMAECAFSGNAASYGGAVRCDESGAVFTRCTFAGNQAAHGGGIWCEAGSSPELDHTLIAFSTQGEGLGCDETVVEPTVTCCNLFGNALGDWVGPIADRLGLAGNISEDPLFCEACLYLQEGSSSADAPGCGQIGAYGVGCLPGGGPTPAESASWGEIKARFRK